MISITRNKEGLKNQRRYPLLFSVLLALILWQLGAMLFEHFVVLGGFLVATPAAVFRRLLALWSQLSFWQTVWFSFSRIVTGFFAALALGSLLAAAAGRFPLLETLFWPYITVIKATPVASFIILCLIWWGSRNLSIIISFLMVLPVIYTNMLQGIRSTDRHLLEMAAVFRAGWGRRLVYIYLPQLKPYLLSACSISLGMTWKSGIAAEVIGIPGGSIGEMLYQAKIYLNAQDLFAWTAVIILISVAFEKLFIALIKIAYRKLEGIGRYEPAVNAGSVAAGRGLWAGAPKAGALEAGTLGAGMQEAGTQEAGGLEDGTQEAGMPEAGTQEAGGLEDGPEVEPSVSERSLPGVAVAQASKPAVETPVLPAGSGFSQPLPDIEVQGLTKVYGNKKVLQDYSATFSGGNCTCIMGDSGVGKTTLLHILMGLEQPDAGSITGLAGLKISAVFQEDRLCESFNAIANIGFACGKKTAPAAITAHLTALGLGDSLEQPVRELSGGMRRRVAICRAVLAAGQVLFLDEPLKGLDEQNKEMTANYIRQYSQGITTLMVTHSQDEVALMGGRLLTVKKEP